MSRRGLTCFAGMMVMFATVARAAPEIAIDLRTAQSRAATVQALETRAQTRKQQAVAIAQQRGWTLRGITSDKREFELMELDEFGQPMYYITMNVQAAISTAADLVRRTAPYNLSGTNQLVGVWDGGWIRDTHQEFVSPGRVSQLGTSADLSSHATHVGGTIGAKGHVAAALGMAPDILIQSYDWNNDESEMAAAAASDQNQTNKIYVSNHSYGTITGWAQGDWSGTEGPHWFGTWGEREARGFGQYSTSARDWDALCHNSSYLLPFKSAGNDRNDTGPSPGATFYRKNASSSWVSKAYDSSVDPYDDGHKSGGYNTIGYVSAAKNVMTVGAVTDAVSGGLRDPAASAMSDFSCWGPADDGRIKPDIVANGVGLYSPTAGSNSEYSTYQGTSMATPNAAGSAMLLIEYYRKLFPGQDMRAATLKGLIIHTADDMGTPGPDYRFGWGLMNTKAAADHIASHLDDPGAHFMVEDTLASGGTRNYAFLWDGVNPIRATISWTDPAGPAQSGLNSTTRVLVNDLDLRVIAPDGTTNSPYVLDPNNYTNAATFGDNIRDNVEQVYIASPSQAGTYTVRVTHKGSLSGGSQAFSLLLSGTTDDPTPKLDTLDWGTITSPKYADTPFTATITAKDQLGDTFTDFTGTASLQAFSLLSTTGSVGSGSVNWVYPFHTFYEDARTQVIYPQSDLGEATVLNGLALNVTAQPGHTLANWTIRMKHTSQAVHSPAAWEGPGSGWITVYRAGETINSTGWNWFTFSTPFDYNGTDNLMIDFSYDTAQWTSNGWVQATTGSAGQTLVYRSDSNDGDPLDWSGTSPAPASTNLVPNLRLRKSVPVTVSPTQTTAFAAGVWTGSITVGQEAEDVVLRASSSEVSGDSIPFDVEPASTPNYGLRDDGGANLPTLTYWHDGLGSDTTEQGSNFNARAFGERTAIYLKGAAIKSWKSGEGDVTGANFRYKIWKQGTAEPGYATRAVAWTSNDGGGDQTWAAFGAEIDALDGLDAGDYNLKILFDITGSGVPGTLESGPFTATFSIAAGPVVLPETETLAATNITATSARLRGRIVSDGGGEILERRFDWGVPPDWSGWTSGVVVAGSDFHYHLTGLEPGTLYQYRAWAENEAGWTNSAQQTFTTLADDPGEPTQFVWGAISATQTANAPFSVSITAADELGSTVTDFTGTAALSAHVATTGTVELVTDRIWALPLRTSLHDSRLQSIYLQSEIGEGGNIVGLALNVSEIPGESLNAWTIRMKHTALNEYALASLDGPDSGWTTVLTQNTTIASTGWVWFDFDAPFAYNGVSNLMVDFSFDNSTASTTGRVYVTTGVVARSVYAASMSTHGNPLDWSGTNNPTVFAGNPYPNIRFIREEAVTMVPTQTTAFAAGVWSGSVTVEEEAAGVFLRAVAGPVTGESGVFNVATDVVPPVNDQCAGAIALADGVTEFQNTANATSDGDPSPSCQPSFGRGVWYSFTPHADGSVLVSTCGSSFDTVLAVYTGACGGLTELVCNDDDGPACAGLQASTNFQATADTTYYILAGGWNSGSGDLQMTATLTADPPAAPVVQPASGVAQTSFTAHWLASSGATNYALDVSAASNFVSFVAGYSNRMAGNATSASVTGLTAGTTHHYRLRAQGEGGWSDHSLAEMVATTEALPNYGLRDDGGANLPTLTYWHDGLGSDTTEQGSNFNARAFGERTAIYLKGAAIKSWKSGEGDVTGANFRYKIWKQGTAEPGYATRAVAWTSDDGGGDQTWAAFGAEIDVLEGLDAGDYNLEILFDITGSGVPGDLSDGPFAATFSVLPEPEGYTLAVVSAHGTPDPAGVTTNAGGTFIPAFLSGSPEAGPDGVQYVCSGALVSGNSFTAHGATNITLTLTNNAVLNWLWTTNYWLSPSAGPDGSVNVAAGWQPAGVTTAITATANAFYHFTRWIGDVSGAQEEQNPLNLLMNAPKTIEAVFAANTTTSAPVPVPEQWFDRFDLAGDFEELALQDSSGDGVPNWIVFVMDMNPTVSGDVLRVEVDAPEGSGNVLSWHSSSGRVYSLYWGTNLQGGITSPIFEDYQPGQTGMATHTDAVHSVETRIFYRVRVGLPPE